MFLRRNYPVYLWDGPAIGRANWGCDVYTYTPQFLDQYNFAAWNFGPSYPTFLNDTQFPVNSTNFAYDFDQAMRARYFKPNTSASALLSVDAATIAVDSGKLGDSVVYITDAAAGLQAMLTTVKSTSGNIKAIVAYECIGYVFPDNVNITQASDPGPFGPYVVPVEDFKKLANISIQFYWGDHRETDNAVYAQFSQYSELAAQLINSYGGNAEVIMLGEAGFPGSTHIAMADMDNDKIAGLLDTFLAKNNLDSYQEAMSSR